MRWEFNEDVAKNFDKIADTNIPKYRAILHKCVELVKQYPKDAHIIDVGCATGNTMEMLINEGYENVYGVDDAEAMVLASAAKDLKIFYSHRFPDDTTWDVVLANWTLHFITDLDKRYKYIQDVYNNMSKGGMFIISEKVRGPEDEYHDFKRRNFLTQKEIIDKRRALNGVLVTAPAEWYRDTLIDVGFKLQILDATYCFRTWMCTK